MSAFSTPPSPPLLLPPHRIPRQDTNANHFASPAPQGVARITIVKAQDLEAADEGFNPTSDPYVTVAVGAESWRTETIPESLEPKWEKANSHNFMVYNPDQWVCIDIFDEDEGKTDDHIGGVIGLPINRLILRCMDKDNKTGTVDIPLVRDNQSVQGETGEVSSVTVKAEWLTVDNSECTDGESLVAITLKDIEGIPPAFTGPFRVRATTHAAGDAQKKIVKTSRESFSLKKGMSPFGIFKQIVSMSKDDLVCGMSHSNDPSTHTLPAQPVAYIADTLSLPLSVVMSASEIINSDVDVTDAMYDVKSLTSERVDKMDEVFVEWAKKTKAALNERDQNDHPYFLDVCDAHTRSTVPQQPHPPHRSCTATLQAAARRCSWSSSTRPAR